MITGDLAKLHKWERKISRMRDPMLRASGLAAIDYRKDISVNFDREVDPYGFKWAKRKHGYKHAPLKKTMAMRRSWKVSQRSPTSGDIVFQAPDPAQYHQEGTEFMAARAVAPNSRGLPPKYIAILKRHQLRELSRAFNRITA
jgi:hypothetical protein